MSLTPAKHNFTIYEGATFYKRIFFQIDGVLQNLTGYSAVLIIKDAPGKTTLLTLTSNEGEGIKLGGVAGTIDLEIDSEDTADLDWSKGVYELLITDSTDRTDLLLRGGFKVVPF